MDLSYYGAVERGERAITILKLSQITNALGIPMRNLFSGEPNYKKELGDLVLDRIFDYHHPERIVPDDFGVLLTPKNIIAHLVQIRAKQREYQRLHPEDVA